MSGTSGDGVDASVISSNGVDKYESIKNKYYQYDDEVYNKIHDLKEQINSPQDSKKFFCNFRFRKENNFISCKNNKRS